MSITNTDSIIDSRDIMERIEELEQLLADESTREEFLDWCTEYDNLSTLAGEASLYSDDWEWGVTLIHENYFTDYCKEMLEDFPTYVVIDWEATTENIKHDYSEVEFNGEKYYYRSV